MRNRIFNVGTASQRPEVGLAKGFKFFDTTLSKPIWWNGTVWVDYNGNVVNDVALKKKGMLSERPDARDLNVPIGYMYMWEKTELDDVTGGQTPTGEVIPIWWNGNDWQDASGNFIASGT